MILPAFYETLSQYPNTQALEVYLKVVEVEMAKTGEVSRAFWDPKGSLLYFIVRDDVSYMSTLHNLTSWANYHKVQAEIMVVMERDWMIMHGSDIIQEAREQNPLVKILETLPSLLPK